MGDFVKTLDWFKKTSVEVDSYHVQATMDKFIQEYKTQIVLFNRKTQVQPGEFYMVEVWANLKSECRLINIYRTVAID